MKKEQLPPGFVRQGNRVVKAPEDSPAPPAPPDPGAAAGTCPKCGAATQDGWKYCAECGAELGAPPGDAASPADAQAFARWALQELGERTLDGARGAFLAERERAAQTSSAEARMADLERERVLERAVAEGKLTAAEAWTFTEGPKGEKLRTFSTWAAPPSASGEGQSLEQLQAFVARRSPSPTVRFVTAQRREPTSDLEEHARRTGRDPKAYAQIAGVIRGRQSVQIENDEET